MHYQQNQIYSVAFLIQTRRAWRMDAYDKNALALNEALYLQRQNDFTLLITGHKHQPQTNMSMKGPIMIEN